MLDTIYSFDGRCAVRVDRYYVRAVFSHVPKPASSVSSGIVVVVGLKLPILGGCNLRPCAKSTPFIIASNKYFGVCNNSNLHISSKDGSAPRGFGHNMGNRATMLVAVGPVSSF